MPLYLGPNIIEEINGPFLMDVLKPVDRGNTFILFGDLHKNYYTPCASQNCVNIHTDFIDMVNRFAETYPTEVLSEDFFLKFPDDVHQGTGISSEIYRSKQALLEGRRPVDEQGIMVDFNKVHYECFNPFYRTNCKYTNIDWSYVDARLTNEYGYSTMIQMLNIWSSLVSIFKYKTSQTPNYVDRNINIVRGLRFARFKNDKTGNQIDHDFLRRLKEEGDTMIQIIFDIGDDDDLENDDDLKFVDYLKKLLVVFSDTPRFIHELLQSPLIQKQYEALTPEQQSIFTPETFIELATNWERVGTFSIPIEESETPERSESEEREWNGISEDACKQKSVIFIQNLINYYETGNEAIMSGLVVTENELNKYIYNLPHTYVSCVLDIYFILRVVKRKTENKLTIGYFGVAHTLNITHYFQNIIRSHNLMAHILGWGKIKIKDIIDLRYLNQTLTIRAGTKKRKYKHRTHRKRTRKGIH